MRFMKKLFLNTLITLVFLVNFFDCFGQFATYQMKELFDLAHSHSYQKRTSHKPLAKYFMNSVPNTLVDEMINTLQFYETETNLGTYRANALESILRMYEHTNDKIYLYEALLEINDIMSSRLDYITNSSFSSSKWFAFESEFNNYNKGLIKKNMLC